MIDERATGELIESILMRCTGNPAEVTLLYNAAELTRFANNTIHQNVAERDAQVTLRYLIGKQIGTASTNRMDQAGLDELVRRAKVNAQTSPADPNYPGLPEPVDYHRVAAGMQSPRLIHPRNVPGQLALFARWQKKKV
jgi:predicted Zn-dependent protease